MEVILGRESRTSANEVWAAAIKVARVRNEHCFAMVAAAIVDRVKGARSAVPLALMLGVLIFVQPHIGLPTTLSVGDSEDGREANDQDAQSDQDAEGEQDPVVRRRSMMRVPVGSVARRPGSRRPIPVRLVLRGRARAADRVDGSSAAEVAAAPEPIKVTAETSTAPEPGTDSDRVTPAAAEVARADGGPPIDFLRAGSTITTEPAMPAAEEEREVGLAVAESVTPASDDVVTAPTGAVGTPSVMDAPPVAPAVDREVLSPFYIATDVATLLTAASDPATGGKRLSATRTATAPMLDGRVDEDIWQLAEVVSDFLQREPSEGRPASERSEARVLYDDRNLYFGFVLHDRDPGAIVATELRRDALRGRNGRPGADDTIAVLLDTFHDHRNAFLFIVNPLGAKYDATIREESQLNDDWDERWEAAARITDRGWEAELAIPWSILRYAGGDRDWGVDFRRQIRRKNEEVAWSNYRQDYELAAVSQAGHLQGLEGLGLRERFRLKPYVTGGFNSFQQTFSPSSEGAADFGIEDLKVKVTPGLTAQFTYNTDFAQVEVDAERSNLTRFSLFFPEKREFFLEAANNFSMGSRGGRFEGWDPPLARLYFSRRIGLSENGTAIPIEFGTRLTGKIGRGNVGLLNVQTRGSQFGGGQNYGAFRWRQDILNRSSIGALATNVQGPDGAYNRVVALDANFNLAENFNLSAFAGQARDNDIDGGSWVGEFRAGWDSDRWEASVEGLLVEEDFRSDLGFILRRDIMRHAYRAGVKPRPRWSFMRQITLSGTYEQYLDMSGREVSRRQGVESWMTFESGDRLFVNHSLNFERLDLPFVIHPQVTIAVGDYAFNDWHFGLRAFAGRPVSGSAWINVGDFYDGSVVSIWAQPFVRLTTQISLQPTYSFNRVRLPAGSFTTHVIGARADFSFSDRLLTDGLVQYNSLTEQLSVFARLRYIFRIGDDFYLVYRQSRLFDGAFSGLSDRSLTGKMTYSFHW